MSKLRRYFVSGDYYFLTNVTIDRIPILVQNIDLYRTAIERTRRRFGEDYAHSSFADYAREGF